MEHVPISSRAPVNRPLTPVLLAVAALSLDAGHSAGQEEPGWAEARQRLVEQIREPGGGVAPVEDRRVLEAIGSVPRHEFVPPALRGRAYENRPLPIGHDQTISQPYIVARMTELAGVEPGDRVLEVGTGSGYQAAVLAELTDSVYSIEIIGELARSARARLERLGYGNVRVRHGDGYRGWPERAPFDAIVVTAAPEEVPPPLVEQLARGGRMVIPVGSRIFGQTLTVLRKTAEGEVERREVSAVRFVPFLREEPGTDGDTAGTGGR
jgi:protein-L-isoaspartate(D-aspartate) O-methyltransferase